MGAQGDQPCSHTSFLFFQNVLAKALYDNVAETPDELSFRKGDIMTVLERNTQGLDGWWLCSLHGRQGIVPGNRLKILVGMYDKKQPAGPGQGQPQPQQPQQLQAPQTSVPYHHQGVYNPLSPASQYTPMHPAYPPQGDNVYLIPAPNKGQQGLYPGSAPGGQFPSPPAKQPAVFPKQTPPHPFQSQGQEIYQIPPSMSPAQDACQGPAGSASPPQDIYQVPPSVGLGQEIYQVPHSMSQTQEIYQVPPSLDMRNWEGPKPQGKVVVPTRVGQVYIYDSPKGEQDEYDIPRHLLSSGSQEIYDVPPIRGGLISQYSQEVYDTPPMAVKGPNSREPSLEIYDIPPSVEKSLPFQTHQTVYDIPPSVSKDVPDDPIREETYDVPSAFTKQKAFDPTRHPLILAHASSASQEHYLPEDIYDVPPPAGKGAPEVSLSQEIYDVPPSLKKLGGPVFPVQDVYDVPRELHTGSKASTDAEGEYIYDVPPQVDRETKAGDAKRLSASSTGSTRSNISTSSLDVIPVKESAAVSKCPSKELSLDLDVAMEMLAKLQHGISSTVSHLMSFISGSWRSPEQMEANAQSIQAAVESVKVALRDLLEFARGAVGNAAQASDRSLYTKLSKQLQKMEDVNQALVRHSQALDSCGWALSTLVASKPGCTDDLDRFIMYSRGIPDDTKQLASFLHGNASLLFKRTKQPATLVDGNSHLPTYQTGSSDKASSIQSRPLPSPPKFLAQESPDGPYENSESGWMEDYDYVHLQGKEEFEKTQKELLEKGNIMWQGKGQLEQQQLKQFERLEQEVTRPIDNDLSNWTPPQHYAQVRGGSALCPSDRQLLLFYLEQCEVNITTLTNAVDAFFTAVGTNQPPKIFVAHSKFVILSAHKLVFIGDTLSRQAKAQDIRQKITHYSNLLCDMLKEIVVTTKTAALQYPSPSAVKDMVDRVKDLANSTQQFRMVLGQLAAM
ncbi:breast cancer anti-estrogen resistance protein 1 isoform X1 [Alligator sinensis]|uniref:Breast cancer anti-estrogen resistance protein 1 n=1 Tax=Alligator sinensis TaxID=38654 RepID=A0A3Q0G7X5_ALLSI|nr:breast cancer anti-estrogen resistance protein 1 isoform X1 [Alligator sinensis]